MFGKAVYVQVVLSFGHIPKLLLIEEISKCYRVKDRLEIVQMFILNMFTVRYLLLPPMPDAELVRSILMVVTSGADIVDYYDTVLSGTEMVFVLDGALSVLAIFNVTSMMLFAFNSSYVIDPTVEVVAWKDATFKQKLEIVKESLLATDLWSTVLTVVFQDGPFAAVRVFYLTVKRERISNIMFFLTKNLVFLMMEIGLITVNFTTYLEQREIDAKEERTSVRSA
ncbi:hypothetical protein ACOME3_005083 [Neoechinorhynchus agilis]